MVYVEVKINEHGQIVIPKIVRDAYGFRPGGTLILKEEKNELVLAPKKSIVDFKKMLDSIPKVKIGKVNSDKSYAEELEERWTT
ncbi:TPA: AbrB/MazE/SpoVT family DNA-binding domain-containing protein [Candidatus Micrarchaeota archaeon]|nr:AbrB/MazE/SpoVT family DNA-binding domain-containing protein [Candidatus Micrarchaeota archaeon]